VRDTVVLVAVVTFVIACGGRPQPPGEKLARVGDELLTEGYLYSQIPKSLSADLDKDVRDELVDLWVRKELLYQEALSRGLDEDPIVATRMHEAAKEALAAELVEQLRTEFALRAAITDDSVRAFYEANVDQMVRRTPEFRASHILLPTEVIADSIYSLLRTGASFDSMAVAVSFDETTRNRGGDMGFFPPDGMLPQIVDFISRNPYPGAQSRPIETRFGWHIVKVTNVQRSGSVRAYEDVEDVLRDRLIAERQTQMLATFEDSLRVVYPPEYYGRVEEHPAGGVR
jgi:peptidyl-prolyl cis-trans isomerase C